MPDNTSNNKRIAKNTALLYVRTLLIMMITLYTSRVILNQLGVEDYGVYQVVGGVVAMFSVISSSLSSSISRFITFELGRGDIQKLNSIFSTSINIQLGISALVLLLGETVGAWFLNAYMNIPVERMVAANWVLQCSLLSFCVGLISVPYNACIIAHEHMTAFAYISILEACLKLAICYMLIISPWDKLISYAVLMLAVSVIIRIIYGIYCNRNFIECHYKLTHEKETLKDMTGFAGWSFLTNVAWIFNTQGINLLINMFFGVTLNAARGIATQVESAVLQFVNNFTTAINPQITKSYAANHREEMYMLVCRGAKFSFLLLLFMALPLMLETDFVLEKWLKVVPEYAPIFTRLSLIAMMVNVLGSSSYTACMATGDIKRYSIWVSLIGFLVFPLSWMGYLLGMPPESTYYFYVIVYIGVLFARYIIMRSLIQFPLSMMWKNVLLPVTVTTLVAIALPILVFLQIQPSVERFLLTCIVSVLSIGTTAYYLGLSKREREVITKKILSKIRH